MKRIRSAEEDFKAPSGFTMEGYLYIQEKREAHRTHVFLVSLSFWWKCIFRIAQSDSI